MLFEAAHFPNKYSVVLLKYNVNSIIFLTIAVKISYFFYYTGLQWYLRKHDVPLYFITIRRSFSDSVGKPRWKMFCWGLTDIRNLRWVIFLFSFLYIPILEIKLVLLSFSDGCCRNNLMTNLSIKLSSINHRKFVTYFANCIILYKYL